MLSANTLLTLVAATPVAVEFGPGVEVLEGYPEKGMRAHVMQAVQESHDTLRLEVTYAAFDAFNQPRETANYYDERGNPTLTAREAGEYKVEETLYLPADEDLSGYLALLDERTQRRMAAFEASDEDNYVAWLEAMADDALASRS
jgi:hypothetical protein